jgi:oligopeptide/dipeptide ABC transporter ATP-binding protein
MIAMAIANDPAVLVADEPTTALDVTIQAQILDVLRSVRDLTGTAIVLVSHDLGVVAGMVESVAVMYAGRVVEHGSVDEIFEHPRHPYTQGLLAAIPRLTDTPGRRLLPIPGVSPTPIRMPQGCAFHPRCPYAQPICRQDDPQLRPLGSVEVACHYAEDLHPRGEPDETQNPLPS